MRPGEHGVVTFLGAGTGRLIGDAVRGDLNTGTMQTVDIRSRFEASGIVRLHGGGRVGGGAEVSMKSHASRL
jgi:hypothetical protein